MRSRSRSPEKARGAAPTEIEAPHGPETEASDVSDMDEDKADRASATYERPTHVTGGMQAIEPHPVATITMTGPREGQSVKPARRENPVAII